MIELAKVQVNLVRRIPCSNWQGLIDG
jgi:hypothetical protein